MIAIRKNEQIKWIYVLNENERKKEVEKTIINSTHSSNFGMDSLDNLLPF